MKVLIEEKKDRDIEFPCLMKSKFRDLVVLFLKDQEGVVVYGGCGTLPFGYYSDGWWMDRFELFNDMLILEN